VRVWVVYVQRCDALSMVGVVAGEGIRSYGVDVCEREAVGVLAMLSTWLAGVPLLALNAVICQCSFPRQNPTTPRVCCGSVKTTRYCTEGRGWAKAVRARDAQGPAFCTLNNTRSHGGRRQVQLGNTCTNRRL
jgi:hypothetical protein